MATENLGLPQFDGSDYISVEPFNDAFTKLDKLGIDYVVESGKVGEWWYRKWSSGRAECGIDNKEFPASAMVAYGNAESGLYRTDYQPIGAYPIQFKSKPNCIVNFIQDKKWADGRRCFVVNDGRGTTTAGPYVAMVDPTKRDAQLVFSVFVSGWYK